MSRTVCGTCWALYDDAGKCECELPALLTVTPAQMAHAEAVERTLTDEKIAELWHQNGGFHHHFARAVERYLKGEK